MDASQYKDYVLVLLFMKYISDRSKNERHALLDIPKGGGFADLVKLKGKAHIGEGVNKVIRKLADANDLRGVIDEADFNDDAKLGKGKEMVDRLSDLIAIFENPALDFSSNQAEGDDLLGDAYEYLMRNFATESGKSKGQFYTPAEVSRIMAAVIGIDKAKSQKETIYDPTCGSGSLLLKAHDAAKNATGHDLAIYGQEIDNATAALSRMNMWMHNAGTAEIANNNTLSTPMFTDGNTGALRTFDYVVANPPFSVKSWTTGVNVGNDPYKRFVYGTPPDKNGDFAFLLHIIASLKSTGKGAVILPHGVLFRGNAEAIIRQKLVKQGFIKGLIGLPGNLFYGTGIPACIIVLDKEGAAARDHIFMIDAAKGFMKDGPKNRLRERDIHRIVSTFLTQTEIEKYSRKVPVSEIADPKNDYNLNLPRYIDTSEPEDLHDLDAHLNGGIPDRDIDALDAHWKVFPNLRQELFESAGQPGYSKLTLPATELSARFIQSAEYSTLKIQAIHELQNWTAAVKPKLLAIDDKSRPKELVKQISEALLATFKASVLLDEYAIYQGLMELSAETLLDDAYLIIDNGWKDGAQLKALPAKAKGEKRAERVDYTINKVEHRSELLPSELLIGKFFEKEARECADALLAAQAKLEELASTYGGEDMLLSDVANDKGEFTKKAVAAALKETKKADEEYAALQEVLVAIEAEAAAKNLAKDLDAKVIAKYGKLTEAEIQQLVVDDKWIGAVESVVEAELARVAGALVARLQQLQRHYGQTTPTLESSAFELSARVRAHLNLIAKKRDIKQAAMQQLLTGRTRLVALDDAWDKACLGEVASFEAGTYLPSNRYQEGSVKVQGAGGQMGWTNSPNFFQPIVVIGRVGTIGEPRFHDGDCWVNNNAAALVPKGSVTAKYLYFVLQSLDFRRFTSTTAQPFLAVTDLLSFVILVPPLAEQVAMVKVLTDMETEIDALVAQREKAELVKQGMMQELLSGRVRLV